MADWLKAATDRPPTRTGGDLWAIGADGAPGGWLAALGYVLDGRLHRVELTLAANFDALVSLRDDRDVPVCVDIPMGLPDAPRYRSCDRVARQLLGSKRQSSVFMPPARSILQAADYQQARRILDAAKLTDANAKSMSAQSWGIVAKVRAADDFLQANPGSQDWLYEVHPELCFDRMAEGQPLDAKRSPRGQAHRMRLLDPYVPDMLEALGRMPVTGDQADMTDALDALAALWTAIRVRRGESEPVGDVEQDSTGLLMRMVR